MAVPPIDPSFAVGGPEWSVRLSDSQLAVGETGTGADSGGFGGMLAEQIQSLEKTQTAAAEASRQLATGTATDLPAVVSAVERAKLSMELASSVRTKAVEAYQEIFRTNV